MSKGADGDIQVARCMAEANLVNGDLVEILADWKEEDTENKTKHRLALACSKPPHSSL
jgi:replication fork protection complex subunit Tof1/Swi1